MQHRILKKGVPIRTREKVGGRIERARKKGIARKKEQEPEQQGGGGGYGDLLQEFSRLLLYC